jgi:preprotein translocase subunit Sec63
VNAGSRDTEENAVAADPYRTLGVAKDASEADIQKAYRRLGDQFVTLKVMLPKEPDPELEKFVARWRPARAERPRATMEA